MTKKERLQVYKDILDQFKTLNSNRGFCTGIIRAKSRINLTISTDIEEYPELMAYKPKKYYIDKNKFHTSYWWSPNNTKHRIEVLEKIIKSMS